MVLELDVRGCAISFESHTSNPTSIIECIQVCYYSSIYPKLVLNYHLVLKGSRLYDMCRIPLRISSKISDILDAPQFEESLVRRGDKM
jgi:hypothetical protein